MTSSLTSDRDYLELVDKRDLTMSASGGSDSDFTTPGTIYEGFNYGVTTINHSVGAVPFVRAYYAPSGGNRYYSTLNYNAGGYQSRANPWILTVASSTTVKVGLLSNTTSNNIPVHVRIYRFKTNTSFTTDEEIDKIFETGSNSRTLSAAASGVAPASATNTIAHSGAADALATLEFSLDQITWYSGGSLAFLGYDTASGPPGGPYTRIYYATALASSDDANIYIYYEHNSNASRTIYTRYVLDYKD